MALVPSLALELTHANSAAKQKKINIKDMKSENKILKIIHDLLATQNNYCPSNV